LTLAEAKFKFAHKITRLAFKIVFPTAVLGSKLILKTEQLFLDYYRPNQNLCKFAWLRKPLLNRMFKNMRLLLHAIVLLVDLGICLTFLSTIKTQYWLSGISTSR
jgi:hypothetical protein